MTSRSRSRGRSVGDGRSWTRSRSLSDRGRSPVPRSQSSRSPSPGRRRDYDRDSRSRSPSRGYRSRSYSRDRSYDSRSRSRSDSRSPGPPDTGSTKIIVERLTKTLNEDHLREIFGQYGEIEDLELPMNIQGEGCHQGLSQQHCGSNDCCPEAGTNRGTAYILYYRRQDAEVAIAHMHKGKIDGAVIDVSIALPRRIFDNPPRRAGFDNRNPPRGPPPGGPFGSTVGPGSRPRRSSGPGNDSSRYGDRSDNYRPRSISRSPSRSRSPNQSGSAGRRYRSRSYSYSSTRSRSPSTGRRGRGDRSGQAYDSRDQRRSPSRGSYVSHGRRGRSQSRDWDRR
ncbi:hypothetical protein V8F20_006383 [Naviculisporaceae sp. PSN 640]